MVKERERGDTRENSDDEEKVQTDEDVDEHEHDARRKETSDDTQGAGTENQGGYNDWLSKILISGPVGLLLLGLKGKGATID